MLKANEALTSILLKYVDFADVFSNDLTAKLLENTRTNDHAINLIKKQQLFYRSIYNLKPVKLKTLKTYIETKLAISFIKSFKFVISVPILFVKKPDGNLQLYIDSRYFNYLTTKNQYPLFLIDEFLNQLGDVKHFTQLNLTSAFHRMCI